MDKDTLRRLSELDAATLFERGMTTLASSWKARIQVEGGGYDLTQLFRPEDAKELLILAARKGHLESQYHLGFALGSGVLPAEDRDTETLRWLGPLADADFKDAQALRCYFFAKKLMSESDRPESIGIPADDIATLYA